MTVLLAPSPSDLFLKNFPIRVDKVFRDITMIEKKLSELLKFLDFPIYIYHKATGYEAYEIDRITFEGEAGFRRNKYLITGDNQCSCMSWMKTKQCKHLKWLNGDFGKLTGCSIDTALEETNRIIENCGEVFPKSREKWWLNAEEYDDTINALVLRFTEPLDMSFLVSIRTFEEIQLGVVFIFDPTAGV